MPFLAEQQFRAARSCAASTSWTFRIVHGSYTQKQQRKWKCVLRCEAAATQQPTSTNVLRLPHPSGCDVHVFGVEHLKAQDQVAEFILETRPSAVVVETSLNPEHGTATGNVLTVDSKVDEFFLSIFQTLGRQMAGESEPAKSPYWQNVKPHWAGEQLAYVAAFAVSADVVFGDEVKHNTFRRLASAASLRDLDEAFGAQCWLNFQEMLEGESSTPLPPESRGVVDHIMLTEREAVMCASLSQAAESGQGGVVGVVGADHLTGIQQLWHAAGWRAVHDAAKAGKATPGSKPADAASQLSSEEHAGVHRALLESVLRLKSVPAVVADSQRALGELPAESFEPYCWAHELYASPRMLLACLSKEQLARVCSGRDCQMWDVLAALRKARPVNGGSALDIDLCMDLRALNLDFS